MQEPRSDTAARRPPHRPLILRPGRDSPSSGRGGPDSVHRKAGMHDTDGLRHSCPAPTTGGARYCGSFTTVTKNSSICLITSTNLLKSTGLLT